RFALEFDALYKRLDYNFSFYDPVAVPGSVAAFLAGSEHNVISRWDFPVLLKYRLQSVSGYGPYLSGGLNTNYGASTTSIGSALFALGLTFAVPPATPHNSALSELTNKSSEGAVVAGGIEFGFHGVRVAPELRYTRWTHENFHAATEVGKFRSNLNQAEVLV